jgi:hypothetical protein
MRRILPGLILILFFEGNAMAQSPTERLETLTRDLVEPYVEPLITGFGTALGSGLFTSAKPHMPLGFDIGVRFMYVPFPEGAKYYDAKVLVYEVEGNTVVETVIVIPDAPTVVGPDTTIGIDTTGGRVAVPPELPPGFDMSALYLGVPQLSVGLPFGTEALLRYISIPIEGDRISLFGWGFKYSLNRGPLSLLPISISLQFVNQTLKAGDVLKSTTTSFNIHASKGIPLLTFYTGIGMEWTSVKVNYELTYLRPNPETGELEEVIESIEHKFKGKNRTRFVIGASLNFFLLKLNFDYNIGKYNAFSAGASISFM